MGNCDFELKNSCCCVAVQFALALLGFHEGGGTSQPPINARQLGELFLGRRAIIISEDLDGG